MDRIKTHQVTWTDDAGTFHGSMVFDQFEEALALFKALQNDSATIITYALGNGGWVPVIERTAQDIQNGSVQIWASNE